MSQASPSSAARVRGACACGKKYSIKASLAGKTARCKCGQLFTVPSAETMRPKVICPFCRMKHRGAGSVCRRCGDKAIHEPANSDRGSADQAPPPSVWWKDTGVHLGLCVFLLVVVVAGAVQTQMNGPDFIGFYVVLGLLSGGTLLVLRHSQCSPLAFVLIFLAFELIGLLRYAWGTSQGMQQFALLFKLMLFGPIGILAVGYLDVIIKESGNSSGYGSSCGGSSCGSSCGGGGCGSGCGGCGGG